MNKPKDVTGGAYDFREAEKSKGKKTLRSMEIERAANGGFVVSHRFKDGPGPGGYHAPEEHVFTDGGELLGHISKHMGIRGAKEEEGEHKGKD